MVCVCVHCLLIADGTSKTQINKVVCHPTLPIIVSAHEDKYIRFYDSNTGKGHQSGYIREGVSGHLCVCVCVCVYVCR